MVNEDPNARIIRELRAEVDALKEMLKHATDMVKIKTFTSLYIIGCRLTNHFDFIPILILIIRNVFISHLLIKSEIVNKIGGNKTLKTIL